MSTDKLFPMPIEAINNVEQILLKHTQAFILNSQYSQSVFSSDILFPALETAGLEKLPQYQTTKEYTLWCQNKTRQMSGILNGNTNVPARWVNVWLSVLPAPYGVSARQEALALFGALNLPDFSALAIPANSADLASLFVEVADVMRKGAQSCADGKYDENDDPQELLDLSNELVDVLEHTIGQILAISQVVNLKDSRAGLVIKALGDKPTRKSTN